jgi:hypothetical protein
MYINYKLRQAQFRQQTSKWQAKQCNVTIKSMQAG